MPLDAAKDALRIGRDAGADALLSDDHEGLGVLVFDHLSGENAAAHKYVGWARSIHEEDGHEAVRQVDSLETFMDHEPVHLAFSGSCARMDELDHRLQAELGMRVKTLCTKYPEEKFHFAGCDESFGLEGRGRRCGSSRTRHRAAGNTGDWR